MRLRPATREDAVALAGVHAAAFEAPWPPEAFTGLLDSPGVFALAAVEDAPVGLILMRVVADEAEVLTLAVSPAHRRRGAGAALLAAALDLAAAAGAQVAFLEVASDNPAAMDLYRAAGFEGAGQRAGYYAREAGPAVDAQVLRRSLNSAGPSVYP